MADTYMGHASPWISGAHTQVGSCHSPICTVPALGVTSLFGVTYESSCQQCQHKLSVSGNNVNSLSTETVNILILKKKSKLFS
jgi:hypothetical protein